MSVVSNDIHLTLIIHSIQDLRQSFSASQLNLYSSRLTLRTLRAVFMTDRVQYSSYTLEWPYSHTWSMGRRERGLRNEGEKLSGWVIEKGSACEGGTEGTREGIRT